MRSPIIEGTIRQARSHQNYWHEPQSGEIVYIALGDSTAIGVGAPDPFQGYVGLLAARLGRATGRSIRTINLAVSGERTRDLLSRQIPRLDELPKPDFMTCVVGANDVAFAPLTRRFDSRPFAANISAILAGLPQHAVVGNVPSFGIWPYDGRVRRVNDLLEDGVTRNGLVLADLYSPTKQLWPWRYWRYASADFFHPNARGHKLWADVLWPLLEAQIDTPPADRLDP